MRFHFVVNPVAGRRAAPRLAAAVVERLEGAGHPSTLYVTTAPGDARAHVATLAEDAFDRLVVAGGDGTLREVVNAVPPPLPWPVGVLRVGTANLVSREVSLPAARDPAAVLAYLLRAEPWPVDLMEVSRPGAPVEWAVATVGVGLDGWVVHRVAQARAARGTGGYRQWIRPLAGALGRLELSMLEATIDGRTTHYGGAVIVQHARSYGGLFTLAPGAALDSGTLHAVLIRGRSRRDLPRLLVGAWCGRLARYSDVRIRPCSEVRVRALDPVPVQADGDAAGTTDLTVRLRPRSLRLLRATSS